MRDPLKCMAVITAMLIFTNVARVANATMEKGVDRPGNDYTSVTLPPGSTVRSCEDLCRADGSRCKAWTFVRAGVQGPDPRCWLKSAVPAPTGNACCVSGVITPTTGEVTSVGRVYPPRTPVTSVGRVNTPSAPDDMDALAKRGQMIATETLLIAELREQVGAGASRRGFDIGLAAAEGNTLPGPGKQRIHDALSQVEQGGFDVAVSFSLQRNANAVLAAKGDSIAKADPTVARARVAEPDAFYWLGFDIATGLFGDPKLGADGNTATGPGAFRIRDSLSPAGQRGFNASVALHLSRNYR